jgi:hypothetical protein
LALNIVLLSYIPGYSTNMSAPQPASQSIPNATPEDPNFLLIAKIDNAKIVINTLQPLAYKKDLVRKSRKDQNNDLPRNFGGFTL